MRNTSKISLLALFILAFFMVSAAEIKAAYVITSLNYEISPSSTVAKIGDIILFQMSVINATSTYSNVSQVVSVTNTSIELASADFPVVVPSNSDPLFVYDGVHTWKVVTGYTNPSIKSVTLLNTNLIAGDVVANYIALQYATFNGVNGSAAVGAPDGSAKVDIGTAVYGINLYDDGNSLHNDLSASDGIYNARFDVREAYQFNVKNGSIVGHFTNVNKASNDPFISPLKINIDSVRPKVELVNASPNPYNPNKELTQFFYYLTENSTVTLAIKLYDTGLNVTNTVKTLAATGYFGYNQPILWDGLSEAGTIQTDGDYIYQFSTVDSAGNTGIVFSGNLKITTVEVITSMYSIDSEFIQNTVPETAVIAKMHVELRNATLAKLRNLGFNYPKAAYDASDFRNYPWVFLDLRFYDITGNVINVLPKDSFELSDTDPLYTDITSPLYSRQFQGYAFPPTGFNVEAFPYGDPCSVTNSVVYTTGDNEQANDWDNCFMFPLDDNGGGKFSSDPTYMFYSLALTPGTYIISFKGVLVGKSIVAPPVVEQGAADCMVGTTTVSMQYFYNACHAFPSYFFDESEGLVGDERGFGLASQLGTISFLVEQNPLIPLPDGEAPSVVSFSEYPSNGITIVPGIIGPANPVKITLSDNGVGAGPVNLSTFVLMDPYGNQVPGKVAWNAGTPGTKTWEIYYIPDSSLTFGGTYSYTVVPVDSSYNIGSPVMYSFNVADTSIPVISNVNVQASTGASQELSPSTSTPVNFLVSKVQATLIPGGSAAVDWTDSNIIVRDASGNTISGISAHVASSSNIEFTPASMLADGSYVVIVTAVSVNDYQGAYSFRFYISTSDVTFINLTGTVENDTTCMRISRFSALDSGIRDSSSTEIDPVDFSVTTINAVLLPANGTYAMLSNTIRFAVLSPHFFPVTFNSSLCSVGIRMHYTDSEAAVLSALGLDEGDLSLWVLSGTTWTQITGIGSPVISGTTTDRYIEFAPAVISGSDNAYALMYAPPAVSPVLYNFHNTKMFNPGLETARLFYTKDIASIGLLGGTGNVKVGIFAMNGSLIRMLEYQDSVENAVVFNTAVNFETDPVNISSRNYYFTWDGKNDRGAYVRNGIYVIKIEITTTTGAKSTLSRTIAVIK